MANLTTTNVDLGNVVLEGVADHDGLFTNVIGITKAGTILARIISTGKFTPFVKGGVADGNGIPKAVLTYDVEHLAIGDVAVRVLEVGKVNFNRLIILADGDNTNVDETVRDELRDFGIEVQNVQDLSILDNQ